MSFPRADAGIPAFNALPQQLAQLQDTLLVKRSPLRLQHCCPLHDSLDTYQRLPSGSWCTDMLQESIMPSSEKKAKKRKADDSEEEPSGMDR
jgi:hypothetical protein